MPLLAAHVVAGLLLMGVHGQGPPSGNPGNAGGNGNGNAGGNGNGNGNGIQWFGVPSDLPPQPRQPPKWKSVPAGTKNRAYPLGLMPPNNPVLPLNSKWQPTVVGAGIPVVSTPAAYDWRTQYGDVPVRDQAQCGSCWAFATIGTVEYGALKATGRAPDLSEQQVVSCDSTNSGCNGGWWAYNYLMQHPPANESCVPYTTETRSGITGTCPSTLANCRTDFTVKSWAYASGSSNVFPTIAQIKSAIYTYGPVIVAVAVTNPFYSYSSGIYSVQTNASINHAVVLVGWDDSNGGSWIMRNSWGSGWGASGYMNIAYSSSSIGYAAAYVVVEPVVPPSPPPTPSISRSPMSGAPTASPVATPSPSRSPSNTNDQCINAIRATCNTVISGSNVGAYQDTQGTCVVGHSGPQVYYYVDVDIGQLTVTTCVSGTTWDTMLNVFTGSCSGLSCLTGNDDVSTCGNGRQSSISVATTPQRYYIMVHGYGGAVNPFGLAINCTAPQNLNDTASPSRSPVSRSRSPSPVASPSPSYSPLPVNDRCGIAIPISCGTVATGSTAALTQDTQATCSSVTHNGPQAYYYVDVAAGQLTASTCTAVTTWDTQISIFSGACGGLTCLNGNDDYCGRQSTVVMNVTAQRYYIMVHGFNGATGLFGLSVTCTQGTPASADPTRSPIPTLSPGSSTSPIPSSSSSSSSSRSPPASPAGSPVASQSQSQSISSSVSRSPSPLGSPSRSQSGSQSGSRSPSPIRSPSRSPSPKPVPTASKSPSQSGSQSRVPSASRSASPIPSQSPNASPSPSASPVPSDSESEAPSASPRPSASEIPSDSESEAPSASPRPSASEIPSDSESEAPSASESPSTSPETSSLSSPSESPLPSPVTSNEVCAMALPLTCGSVVMGDTQLATLDNTPSCGAGHDAPQLWYYIDVPNGQTTISLCNAATTWDTQLSVYSDCGTLTCVADNDDACGSQSSITLTVAGRYYVMVHGFDMAAGPFSLSVTCFNDQCVQAKPVTCGTLIKGNTAKATYDGTQTCEVTRSESPQLWYYVDALPGQLVASTCYRATGNWDSQVSIFTGTDCGALQCVTGNNDAGCGSKAIASTEAVGGRYYIMVHGATSSSAGTFVLNLTCGSAAPSPGLSNSRAGGLGKPQTSTTTENSTTSSSGSNGALYGLLALLVLAVVVVGYVICRRISLKRAAEATDADTFVYEVEEGASAVTLPVPFSGAPAVDGHGPSRQGSLRLPRIPRRLSSTSDYAALNENCLAPQPSRNTSIRRNPQ